MWDGMAVGPGDVWGTDVSEQLEFNDRSLALCLARVSEAGALSSAGFIGRGDEEAATEAAVNGMQIALNRMDISGHIVVGEGEEGDVPDLFVGQTTGNGNGPNVDIALEALEGKTLVAKGMPNALSVIAMGPRGSMMQAPDLYMDKLAIGPGYPDGLVTLDMSPTERISVLAKAKSCAPGDLTVCVLDRPRHEDLIAELRQTGARVRLISDGDVAGVIHVAEAARTGIDVYMGIGGAPEGVLAAAALKCLGGQIEGRLVLRSPDDAMLARMAGITAPDQIFKRDDMIGAEVVFAATGVTDGALLHGIRQPTGQIEAETLLMRSRTGSVRFLSYRKKLRQVAG